jgi:hypothetical protein
VFTIARIWILPWISTRLWLPRSIFVSWSLRSLLDNSIILSTYHKLPEQGSSQIAHIREGGRFNEFFTVLQILAIWALVLCLLLQIM